MTLVIAEAGVNHNGDENLAHELIEIAASSGADIVKFQTFKAKNLLTDSAPLADYQLRNASSFSSQLEMLSKLELPFKTFIKLKKYSESKGIEFLSTAFDSKSLQFINTLNLKRLKIPSGDLTNSPLLLLHAKTNKQIILSTGMASLDEIESALGVIAFGYLQHSNVMPSIKNFSNAFQSSEGQKILEQKVTLLHCTSEYPAPLDEVNLNAINLLKSKFGLQVGYSDHTEGISSAIAATALGATIIEKHFTSNKDLEGPDHVASLNPIELSGMIQAIREVTKSLGDYAKKPTRSEIKNLEIARKSIVANIKISKGEKFTTKNLTTKRPGTGLSPVFYWDLIGKHADKDYKSGDLISKLID